ncbi:cupin domain-containing protein [Micromonospora sp. NPDC048935]|uniref:cupin domain-containing protein n=1 Tax=Micromonospora sp. NPDC048935 TaxID=3364262 RepID=UPI003711798C
MPIGVQSKGQSAIVEGVDNDTGTRGPGRGSRQRPGTDGAPPHLHTHSGELFFVLDGALEMLVGDELHTLHRGDTLFVPPNTPHAFAPADGQDADFLVVITPGKPRFDYYRLLDRVHRGDATWQDVGETQDRYDNHYVDSALWAGRRG